MIAERIAATRNRYADLAYPGPQDLLAELRVVQDSLARAGEKRKAYGDIQQLIWQVQTFGFHLAELEVRQHAKEHARTLAAIEAGAGLSPVREGALETGRD